VASGWRKAGTPRPPRRSLKYLGVREALVTAGDTRPYLRGAQPGDLILTTVRKRDRSLELVRVEPDGTRHLKRWALAPRSGRRYVIVLPFVARKEELAHGISLRTLLWGAEFKNEAVARDVLRAFQTGGTIAVADLVPTTSIFGSATFNRVGVKSIEVAA
jgi:hypothetical protein